MCFSVKFPLPPCPCCSSSLAVLPVSPGLFPPGLSSRGPLGSSAVPAGRQALKDRMSCVTVQPWPLCLSGPPGLPSPPCLHLFCIGVTDLRLLHAYARDGFVEHSHLLLCHFWLVSCRREQGGWVSMPGAGWHAGEGGGSGGPATGHEVCWVRLVWGGRCRGAYYRRTVPCSAHL